MANIIRRTPIQTANRVKLGLYSFDKAFEDAIGNYGIPLRSFWEVSGHTGVGKTTFALSVMANVACKLGRQTIQIIDLERQSDETMNGILDAAGYSGDTEILTYADAYDSKGKRKNEVLLQEYVSCIHDGGIPLLDSVGAYTTTSEIQSKIGDAVVGSKGQVIGQWSKQVVDQIATSEVPTIAMFTNHLHQPFGGNSFIPVYHTSGGTTKKYLATHAIRIKEAYLKGITTDFPLGRLIEGKVEKNRDGYKGRKFYIFSVDGEGIHVGLTAMLESIIAGLAQVSRGVVSVDGQKIGNIQKIMETRHSDPQIFVPFINSLASLANPIEIPEEEVEEEIDSESTPKKKSRKKKEDENE